MICSFPLGISSDPTPRREKMNAPLLEFPFSKIHEIQGAVILLSKDEKASSLYLLLTLSAVHEGLIIRKDANI